MRTFKTLAIIAICLFSMFAMSGCRLGQANPFNLGGGGAGGGGSFMSAPS
jgi:hypothetical protein